MGGWGGGGVVSRYLSFTCPSSPQRTASREKVQQRKRSSLLTAQHLVDSAAWGRCSTSCGFSSLVARPTPVLLSSGKCQVVKVLSTVR